MSDMCIVHDPDTGEVLDPVSVKASRSRARRAVYDWTSLPDGTRIRTKNGVPQFPPGTWRWDIDNEGHRYKRALTIEELAAREVSKADRESQFAAHMRLMEELVPAWRGPEDPPVSTFDSRLARCDARLLAGEELALLDRPRGGKLRLVGRIYDGAGIDGHDPIIYATAHALFRDGHGNLWRSRGVMITREQLRPFAAALTAYADKLDAAEHDGTLPDVINIAGAPIEERATEDDAERLADAVPEREPPRGMRTCSRRPTGARGVASPPGEASTTRSRAGAC